MVDERTCSVFFEFLVYVALLAAVFEVLVTPSHENSFIFFLDFSKDDDHDMFKILKEE
jgi:hypothetical protein